jgi:hypothetical protein
VQPAARTEHTAPAESVSAADTVASQSAAAAPTEAELHVVTDSPLGETPPHQVVGAPSSPLPTTTVLTINSRAGTYLWRGTTRPGQRAHPWRVAEARAGVSKRSIQRYRRGGPASPSSQTAVVQLRRSKTDQEQVVQLKRLRAEHDDLAKIA